MLGAVWDSFVFFVKEIIILFISPFVMAYRALGIFGSGADIYIYGTTHNLFPTIIATSFGLSLVAGFIKFIWHY